jgi:alpha-tubulin suppressor-like RCC1 family protein
MAAGGMRKMLLASLAILVGALALPGVSEAASTFAWGVQLTLGLENPAEWAQSGFVQQPAPMPLTGVSDIAPATSFGLALTSGGAVYSWGQNGHGQLGNGTTTNEFHPAPVGIAGTVTGVAAGPLAGYALLENGTVDVWGSNGEGQLGQGSHTGPETCASTPCSKSPIPVPGLEHVQAIDVGGSHALALLENGTVVAWGANSRGQLGDGTTVEKDSPVAVSGLSEVVAIAAGRQFSLALLANGHVMAWGGNESGQLGNGSTTGSSVPVAVTGLSEVKQVAAGGFHALALLENGEAKAWGDNNEGQLGNGNPHVNSTVPVAVKGLTGATSLAAGEFDSMALVAGGQAEAWGEDSEGQLGNGGGSTSSGVPAPIACGLHELQGIAASQSTTYAWGAEQGTCPGIASVTPDEGPAEGGTEVTIAGSELGSTSAVSFGSTPASSFKVESGTEVTAVAPPGSETVDVRVTNSSGTSVAALPDEFVYAGLPTVTHVSPDFGHGGPGNQIEITGTNFGHASAVHFGALTTTTILTTSSHTLVAVIPAGGKGVVDVTVTNPTGTSEANSADRFMYETSLEFGRCLKGEIGGTYTDKSCTIEGELSTPYQWRPAAFGAHPLEKPGVQLGSGSVTIENTEKLKLACSGVHAAGHVSDYNIISFEGLVLTGCAIAKLGSCTSTATAGEVVTVPLTARLGSAKKKPTLAEPGLQIGPASGEQVASMTCGAHTVVVSGSFVALTAKHDQMVTTSKLQAKEKKGVPSISGLDGEPPVSLGVQVDGGPVKPAGVKMKAIETNEEAFEIR